MTSQNSKISLVKDTIDKKDINELVKWLKTNPRLTKGELTLEFENNWSNWLGCKYSVFVNSGSSANLAAIYALMVSGKLKNNKIVVPAISWVTTVAPAIQLGLDPIMCDADGNNLGLSVRNLKKIIKELTENREITVLISSHDLTHVTEVCERIVVLEKGNIVKDMETSAETLQELESYFAV